MKPFHALLFVPSKQPTWMEKGCSYRPEYGSYPLTSRVGTLGAVAVVLLAIATLAPLGSSAMELKTVGNQLILSGPVVGDEPGKVTEALTQSSAITTVVLRNSQGGNAPAGYQVGQLLRERGIRTAVSGYCYSSCSRMFLGGRTRSFTDDYPAEYTHIGFHGHYDAHGHLNAGLVRQYGLGQWIMQYSDGKADPQLVERWIHIPSGRGMIHFFHPGLLQRGGVSTFLCQGDESTGLVFACEPIRRTALELGIVTSLEIVQSTDQAALRAALPARPPASGFAAIDDDSRLPVSVARGIEEYRRFLQSGIPRAFAVAPDGKSWAWHAGTVDAIALAVARCGERSSQSCQLYAVDEDVVWVRK